MYYRGAAVALLVYDVTSEDSFSSVKEWVKELRANIYDKIRIYYFFFFKTRINFFKNSNSNIYSFGSRWKSN